MNLFDTLSVLRGRLKTGSAAFCFSRIGNGVFAGTMIMVFGIAACASAATPPPPPPPPPPVATPPPPAPTGPTRTDFKTIAKRLVSRCVGGGWINAWRAEHEDVDAARPKVRLLPFEDRTEQELDPTYLKTILAQRMRLSGVFDVASEEDTQVDFNGKGTLLRLAEQRGGQRYSVYTATLEITDPETDGVVHACEATVEGEM